MKIYKLVINSADESGMDAISLVENPAVEVDFLAFDKMEKMHFDQEKREISGVVCLADTPIYRCNQRFGEHYIIFEKDVIKQMVLKYSKLGLTNNVNINHQGELISGLTMVESYIKDSARGIAPVEFRQVPDGSWMATFKVENDQVWEQIKQASLKGFSLQGLFGYGDEVELSKEQTYEEWIEEIINNIKA